MENLTDIVITKNFINGISIYVCLTLLDKSELYQSRQTEQYELISRLIFIFYEKKLLFKNNLQNHLFKLEKIELPQSQALHHATGNES